MSTQDLVVVTAQWYYSAAQDPPGGLEGKPASALEGVRAMTGRAGRKELWCRILRKFKVEDSDLGGLRTKELFETLSFESGECEDCLKSECRGQE